MESTTSLTYKKSISNKNSVFMLNNYFLKFAVYFGCLDKSYATNNEYTDNLIQKKFKTNIYA